jgi:hypothetical protein
VSTANRLDRPHEWRRLYLAAAELMRAINAGEAEVSGVGGWVWNDILRALERLEQSGGPEVSR